MCQASTFNDLQRKLPIISRSIPKKKTDQPSPNTQRMRSIEKREKSSLKLMKELKTEKKKHQIRVEKSQAEFDARVKAEADKRLEQMSNFLPFGLPFSMNFCLQKRNGWKRTRKPKKRRC